jgi:1-acyl-sn-glycerol-3-phosphate acyltransferase
MLNPLLRFFFKLRGWKVVSTFPDNVKKAIFAVAPHTVWQDFLLGICARATLYKDIRYLGKAELFVFPIGWIFRALGGTPLVRSKSNNQVQNVAETFNQYEDLLVALAPEGTRKNVEKLRTGFYFMAVSAKVPIIMVGFDYPQKQVKFADPFMPSGDFEKDMQQYFVPFFKNIQGVHKNWLKNYEEGRF